MAAGWVALWRAQATARRAAMTIRMALALAKTLPTTPAPCPARSATRTLAASRPVQPGPFLVPSPPPEALRVPTASSVSVAWIAASARPAQPGWPATRAAPFAPRTASSRCERRLRATARANQGQIVDPEVEFFAPFTDEELEACDRRAVGRQILRERLERQGELLPVGTDVERPRWQR